MSEAWISRIYHRLVITPEGPKVVRFVERRRIDGD